MSPLVSIIILTRNALHYTEQCIESILQHTNEAFELIFVDNGSTDGTLDYLQTVPNARCIRSEQNLGFAGGNNQGMTAATGEYICLLNNDTVVTPGWLTRMLVWLIKNPAIGIVGPRSNNVAWAQRVHPSYQTMTEMHQFAQEWTQQHKDQGFVPHKLIGHCMLFHKELIHRIGFLDERFFPGNYEDDDFCLRARISGKQLWVANDVYIHHYGGSTFRANRFNYTSSALNNADRFARKWSLGISGFELDHYGYQPSEIVEREKPFRAARHFIPAPSRLPSP
ncbi:glycosyltransferase family 2 protein [Paenibacillus sp. y28]|uniref:glycosyltransferase family 2 protein n=1 Tax=Paenibacillus sp. y28 TaxID=3129110 RepID=UPI003019BCEB